MVMLTEGYGAEYAATLNSIYAYVDCAYSAGCLLCVWPCRRCDWESHLQKALPACRYCIMAREILLSKKTEQGLRLDPRTKLLLIFIISIFVMGGTGGEAMGLIRLVLCAVPATIAAYLETMCKSCRLYCCVFCFLCCSNLCFAAPYGNIEFPRSVYNRILLPYPSQRCNRCLCSENNNGQ